MFPSKPTSIGRAGLADDLGAPTRVTRWASFRRAWIFAALAISEIILATFLFDFDLPRPAFTYWQNPIVYASALAKMLVLAFPLFLMVVWPRRQELIAAYSRACARPGLPYAIGLNVALFAGLLLSKFTFSNMAELSLSAVTFYAGLLLATGASLALVAAPPSFWRQLLTLAPVEIALALLSASVAAGAGRLAQEGWGPLSSATLAVSHWFLTLYEPDAFVNSEHWILGVGDFRVQVLGACSGYEGVALIVAFLSIYMWVFRRDLKFPNVLLLFPIGVATMWTLNALRIAVLVSIGAHVSPDVAIQGFHSAAGWICFLAVTLASIAISRRVPYFAPQSPAAPAQPVEPAAAAPSSGSVVALQYLGPFMALVGASIIASAFAPHDQWLYAVRVVAIGAVLYWFRDAYLPLLSGASWFSVVVGLAVGVVWIATDPASDVASPLGPWLAALPLWAALLWLTLRAIGSIALVPVAEELAFRGYLARVLVSPKFEQVGFGEFRLLAFVVSSVAFGLMHQRWLAACLAGAVYALLMYRSKRLSDPIAAHAASNAAIMGWAVATEQWSLL
ncbi:exosortase E/protease, VPEID-CTERM system [Hyphomicrobium sp.]|uniref:exosortase E/protease, VPEID-CTERM system n=1 Tax=Hyphomicrobium sp. TaxID=82 RepID=UPI0025BC1C79|nr:exosortase E/protease, VPEID-CTERM system [Hyphomicrobium sp.]MCC7250768.1 exosortase E/protease, VPEID-CTERM system [Hyphomicrobium sp.]